MLYKWSATLPQRALAGGALTCSAVRGSKDTQREQRELAKVRPPQREEYLHNVTPIHLPPKKWVNKSSPSAEETNFQLSFSYYTRRAPVSSPQQDDRIFWADAPIWSLFVTDQRGWHSPEGAASLPWQMLPLLWQVCRAALKIQADKSRTGSRCGELEDRLGLRNPQFHRNIQLISEVCWGCHSNRARG